MYGLCVFSGCGQEVAIGTDEEADKAAAEYIKDSVWSIRPEYIASHTKRGASNDMIKAMSLEAPLFVCEAMYSGRILHTLSFMYSAAALSASSSVPIATSCPQPENTQSPYIS